MANEKEPVKVTSGKDFVAAKPAPVKEPVQEAPKDTGPSAEQVLADKEAAIKKLEDEHNERVAQLEADRQKLEREQHEHREKQRAWNEEQSAIAAAKANRDNELGKAHFSGDNVTRQGVQRDIDDEDDHPTNARGKPIPVAEQNQRVRHISEIGDDYNGKSETIPGSDKDPDNV